ncbi:DUF2752 domain-containing protein [Ruminiclostridium herbifermentans]|uniref:DUF2752 domain-containing protein n=2 Tax=Ruminiclostridium herbifermentans TaxID=2488810 RepID=A0A4U7JIS6_9FIRM|nr:DUF2752 domain-containing protein [Ruminiclostridium herbifermentans]
MKKKIPLLKILVCIFPLFTIGMIFAFRNILYKLSTHLPACPIYKYFHVYCPGCGNTRSVQYLLKGDVLNSLKFNITPVFILILGTLAYIELVLYIFGKNIKIIPRKKIFWVSIIILFILYYIARNVWNIAAL